eukprot:gene632-10335_t
MDTLNSSALFLYMHELPASVSLTVTVMYSLLSPVTFFVNIALFFSFIATKQAWLNSSNTLVTCKAFVDTLNGAIALPSLIFVRVYYSYSALYLLKKATQFLVPFLGYLSTLIVLLLALDRYLHMKMSMTLKRASMTRFFQGKLIIFPLSLAIVLAFFISSLFLYLDLFGQLGFIIIMVIATILKFFLIPGMAFLYIHGYQKVRKAVLKNPIYSGYFGENPVDGIDKTKNVKNSKNKDALKVSSRCPAYLQHLQKTVFLLIIWIPVTYLPLFVVGTVKLSYEVAGHKSVTLSIAYDFASLLFFFNFIINALIIFKMNSRARLWIIQKVSRLRRRRNTNPEAKSG